MRSVEVRHTDRPLPASSGSGYAIAQSERKVKMVILKDHFLRSCATGTDPLRVGRCSASDKACSWSDKVDTTSFEMVRARYATHRAIAFNRPTTAANSEVGMPSQKAVQVQSSMRRQPPTLD